MKTVCDMNQCTGCGACRSICPRECIDIVDTVDTLNARIDENICIGCKQCEKVCPNITSLERHRPIEWYQGWATDEIRKRSTSGGAAAAITRAFIRSGGFVASCVFKDGEFGFAITNDLREAEKFTGSKYVKSNIGVTYNEIYNRLKSDKVLFIGLPCQVAAVKKYVHNNPNLYTVDLICHGTPSVKLLQKYLDEKGINIKAINNIKFREKDDMALRINNERKLMHPITDSYLCAFLSGVGYTQNCYHCQYANLNRISDVTVGDSWGSEYSRELKKGISLVLIQTQKGRDLISNSNMVLKEVDLNIAVSNNQQLSTPSRKTIKQTIFAYCIRKNMDFDTAAMIAIPWMTIKQKLKRVLIALGWRKQGGVHNNY